MIFQINFQVKEKKSKVKGYRVSATDLIEVIGPSKISSINGSFPSVYFSSLWTCGPFSTHFAKKVISSQFLAKILKGDRVRGI